MWQPRRAKVELKRGANMGLVSISAPRAAHATPDGDHDPDGESWRNVPPARTPSRRRPRYPFALV